MGVPCLDSRLTPADLIGSLPSAMTASILQTTNELLRKRLAGAVNVVES